MWTKVRIFDKQYASRELSVSANHYTSLHLCVYIYIYIYMCVCVCVCVRIYSMCLMNS